MLPLSVVILTKNEERNIARCLSPLAGITDDIAIVDSGSTDKTIAIAKSMGARVLNVIWRGYATTKNDAHISAKYNWILSLDADEEINAELKTALQTLFSQEVQENTAYLIQRKMVYCGTVLHHGALANEYRLRVFNKKNACWNENAVHEDIVFNTAVSKHKLEGFIWHHSYNTKEEHVQKIMHYAQLFARQKKAAGKNISVYKKLLSPLFGFIKNFIFKKGFLDGTKGLQYALIEMKYTRMKYELAMQK